MLAISQASFSEHKGSNSCHCNSSCCSTATSPSSAALGITRPMERHRATMPISRPLDMQCKTLTFDNEAQFAGHYHAVSAAAPQIHAGVGALQCPVVLAASMTCTAKASDLYVLYIHS